MKQIECVTLRDAGGPFERWAFIYEHLDGKLSYSVHQGYDSKNIYNSDRFYDLEFLKQHIKSNYSYSQYWELVFGSQH